MPKTPQRVEAGRWVRRAREGLNLTRRELAERLGVEPKTVQQVELGYQGMHPGRIEMLNKMAEDGGVVIPGKPHADHSTTLGVWVKDWSPERNAKANAVWQEMNSTRRRDPLMGTGKSVRDIVHMALNPGLNEKARKVAAVAFCDEEEALTFLIEKELNKMA